MFKNKLGKKAIVALLTMSMAVSGTACGKKSENVGTKGNDSTAKTEDTKKEETKTENTTASGEKTKIRVYRSTMNIGSPDEAQDKAVQDKINEYIGDKIGVEIELHDIASGEFQDKVNLALVGGEIDLLWTASWQGVVNCDNIVRQNAVADITDLLPKYDIYNSVPSFVWTDSQYAGKNYFVPCYKESAEGYNLAFRKDLVDKYGWDVSSVKALKDIEPMLKACKDEGLKYPYLTQKTAMFFRYYMDRFDFFLGDANAAWVAVDKNTNQVVDPVTTPEYKEFCTLMADWAAKGYLSEDDLTKTTGDSTTQGTDWGITWWTDVPNNAEASTRWKKEVVMAKVTDNWRGSNGTLGSCFCISSKCDDTTKDACMKFLSLLYTDNTVANLYTYGIEGINYTLEDGRVKRDPNSGYAHGVWESTSIIPVTLEVGEPEDKVALYETFNTTSKDSPALGFRFDQTSVETEIAACRQVFEEFGFVLEHGGYAVDQVEQGIKDYQAALDNAGYQKILEAATTQFNDWIKTK